MAEPASEGNSLVVHLREAIKHSGQSLYQLAQATGVGRDRLSRFLRGERDLTLEAADRLCQALGLVLTKREAPPAPEPPQADPDMLKKKVRKKKAEG